MLQLLGIVAEMVEVKDNNGIDAVVAKYRPTHVIIEGIWLIPTKLDVLKKLHPLVTWTVRDHSQTAFLAHESMALGWIAGYLARGCQVMGNAPNAVTDLQAVAQATGNQQGLVLYGPNYYPVHVATPPLTARPPTPDETVRVGCFGAIRPLKNQLAQAIAALRYAALVGKRLEFHINATRIEGQAAAVLSNIRALFAATPKATLVEQPWLDHAQFLGLLTTMDICLQVSFSETFNIVTADACNVGVPVVTSPQVPWIGSYAVADPNSTDSILQQMLAVHSQIRQQRLQWQWRDLSDYCLKTQQTWWKLYGNGQQLPRVPVALQRHHHHHHHYDPPKPKPHPHPHPHPHPYC